MFFKNETKCHFSVQRFYPKAQGFVFSQIMLM